MEGLSQTLLHQYLTFFWPAMNFATPRCWSCFVSNEPFSDGFNFRRVYWLNAQPWAAKKYLESQGKPSNDCRSPRHLSGVNLCVPHVHVQIIHLFIDVYRYTDTCILEYVLFFLLQERGGCISKVLSIQYLHIYHNYDCNIIFTLW